MRERPPATWGWLDDVAAARALSGRERVLCLDDAGDRALAHALGGAEVLACTRWPALLALKRAGGALAWPEHLQLLGLLPFGRRVWVYHRAREGLSVEHRAFWDAREDWIREGVLAQGELEQRAAAMRRRLVPWALSARRLQQALAGQGEALEGLRWRALAARHLGPCAAASASDKASPDNPFLEWLLTGAVQAPGRARVYLSEAGHAALPAARLRAVSSAEAMPERRFDAIDIGATAFAEAPIARLSPGGVLLWWSEDPAPPSGFEALTPPLPDRSPMAPPLRLARRL